jgi:selenocysteine lyase/cysteine desulfurase
MSMKTLTVVNEGISEISADTLTDNSQYDRVITNDARKTLSESIKAALETYSNVHRGSGHFSKITTRLYEKAREIVLEYLELRKQSYHVVFCTPARAETLQQKLKAGSFYVLRSKEFGLHLGVVAVAVRKKSLSLKIPFEAGGGTTKLYGEDWVMWVNSPEKFEPGTPGIINIIAFARALQLIKKWGKNLFNNSLPLNQNAVEILGSNGQETGTAKDLPDELRNSFTGKNVKVPTTSGLKTFVNLDAAASTPAFGPVADTFLNTIFQPEKTQQKVIGEARKICAGFLNAPLSGYDIMFTSNTTESINIVAQNINDIVGNATEPVILTSILEHSSNDLPWRTVPGATVIRLGLDMDGFFDLKELETLLRTYNIDHKYGKKRIVLVALSGASNVLGTCNDLQAAGKLVKKYNSLFLVDAAQLAAHREIDMQAMQTDFLAFSAHKVYAPFGAGVLAVRKGLFQFSSEEQEKIRLSGEDNGAGIAALGKALFLLQRIGFELIKEEERKLMTKVLLAISEIPDLNIYGIKKPDSSKYNQKTGVIVFDVKDRMAGKIAAKLAYQGGIGIRFGCHCAHLVVKDVLNFTPFQEKFQKFVLKLLPFITLQGLSRVSFGIHNTEEDADRFVEVLRRIVLKSEKREKVQIVYKSGSEKKYTEKEVKQQITDFIALREQMVYG